VTQPRPPRAPVDLRRTRDLGALVTDAFTVYFRSFRTFVTIAAAVVIPVQLIVGGLGLGELTRSYDPTPGAAQQLVPFAASLLVIAPLTTAMCIYALLDLADGRKPRAVSAIQRGLDVFAPVLAVIVMYVLGVAVGFLALIAPGVYLLVRWVFAIQATVIDGKRGIESLNRSGDLVQGSWWRVAGITLASNFLLSGLSALVGAPFLAAAQSTHSAAFELAGQIVGGVLFAAPAALITTLLYFDQRARKGL
jgi:hypothetical protein